MRENHSWQPTSASLTRSSSMELGSLTPLPRDISPFDKSASKGRDIQGDLRKLATTALERALSSTEDPPTVLELEFPPLIGGDQSKSQFDDFDNVQELNQNRDWCNKKSNEDKRVWFVLPDTKEVELCKEEWTGERYRQSAAFSSIEAVAQHYSASDDKKGYSKPWGATFANAVNKLVKGSNDEDGSGGGSGLLGDERALDSLSDGDLASLHLVCQPGNGGPVEDWINVRQFHDNAAAQASGAGPITIVVNGALDKVRDGYYAPFIFPALAKTFDFYRSFEPLLFLKPVSDKGLYGWLFKVYGEPWQLFLQKPRSVTKAATTVFEVEDVRALVSDTRPTYQECIQALLACNAELN
eukprot:jgi/Psemu1/297528/fgenesh1_pm.307_\